MQKSLLFGPVHSYNKGMTIKELNGAPFHLRADAVYCEGEDKWYLVTTVPHSHVAKVSAKHGYPIPPLPVWVTCIMAMKEEPKDTSEESTNSKWFEGEIAGNAGPAFARPNPIAASKAHREMCRSAEMGLASMYWTLVEATEEKGE